MRNPAWPRMLKTPFRPLVKWLVLLAILLAATGALAVTSSGWLPAAERLMARLRPVSPGPPQEDTHDDLAQHAENEGGDGDHPGHDEATSLTLSDQARRNVGLRLLTIAPRDFDRTITVPAMIIERPGRTQLKVSAPMTGVVTRIYPIRGEAVAPGQPLFDLRLTHEDLVQTQSTFLETVEQLAVVKREVARLEEVTASGVIAGKRLLERQYEQQQTEARLRAQRQALILHGLSEKQVDDISASRRLLQDVTIVAPQPTDSEACGEHDEFLEVAELAVSPGEQVAAGTQLCMLGDHCELYIEGRAFAEDAQELNEVASRGTPVEAVVEANGKGSLAISDLRILYVENEVEQESRALRFYVRLPNRLVRNEKTADGHRFIGWRYKPGQRVQVLVPVERWENRVVLPLDAVVKEGVDWFVFQQNGEHFDRRPVHVEYRDQRWAVIAADGTLRAGDVVAASGAYQMHLALKNQTGGGVDPHAGHQH